MKYRWRLYFTETQKVLMWERWQKDDSLHDIARLFDRGHSSIQRILRETGGIRPSNRRRSPISLTFSEREVISRWLAMQLTMKTIATLVERHSRYVMVAKVNNRCADTVIQVYSCDPHSPWERGSNENTIRQLRQYFPKGTDISNHSQVQLNKVARELNERPRKR